METTGHITSKNALSENRLPASRSLARNLDKTRTHYHLSDRECAVLELLSEGYSDKEIATTLRITPFTVNKHVGAILTKMNVRSRTAAAVHAIREHLFADVSGAKALSLTG